MQKKPEDFNVVVKQLRLMGKLSAVFIIICFMVAFQNLSFGIGMFVVLAFYFIFFYRRKVRLYQKELKNAILTGSFRPTLGEITFNAKDPEARKAVAESGLLPLAQPDGLVVRDTVRGTCYGCPAFLTDVTANYFTTRTDKHGKEARALEYLSGCCFEVEPNSKLPREFILWHRECMPEEARSAHLTGWSKSPIPCEEDDPPEYLPLLAEKYDLYVPQGQKPPELWDRFIRAFGQLVEFTPGHAVLQVSEHRIRIFIESRFVYTLQIPVYQPVTNAILHADAFPEMEYMVRVVNTVMRLR